MSDPPFDDEDDPWILTLVVETRKGFPVSEAEVYEAAARAVASARDAHHDLFQAYEQSGRIRKLVRHASPARFGAVSGMAQCLVVAAAGVARVAVVAPSPRSVVPAVVAISPAQAMTVLKTAAQVGHAAQLMHAHLSSRGDDALLDVWRAVDFATSVAFPSLAEWGVYARAPVVVRDAGFTEVPAGAHTVSALPRPP
jgi:peptidyl-tRNA hydrolase